MQLVMGLHCNHIPGARVHLRHARTSLGCSHTLPSGAHSLPREGAGSSRCTLASLSTTKTCTLITVSAALLLREPAFGHQHLGAGLCSAAGLQLPRGLAGCCAETTCLLARTATAHPPVAAWQARLQRPWKKEPELAFCAGAAFGQLVPVLGPLARQRLALPAWAVSSSPTSGSADGRWPAILADC